MQFWAMLKDAFRESLERRIFWVLILLTALVALTMLSVGFEADRVTFMFGSFPVKTPEYNPLLAMGQTRIISLVVYMLVSLAFGWVGVILMVVATASFFPRFLERGQIDVVLAKPISRPRLFLYRYLSGMIFVLVQGAIFVGATFLAMGFRWHVWVPGYLLAIPLLVLLFSYVYCVSVLVAVKTRSSVAAILVSIFSWAAFALVAQAPSVFHAFPDLKQWERTYTMVRVISWIPPKTSDFPYLVARWTNAGTSLDMFPEQMFESAPAESRRDIQTSREIEERELKKNPWLSIGSSLAFEAVVVLLAMWRFCRMDF